jgi:hypothetical protein
MRHTHLAWRTLAAASALLAVTACADVRQSLFGKDAPQPPCPDVAIVPDAEYVTKFAAGKGRDLIDVVAEARMLDIVGACEHSFAKNSDTGTLLVELQVQMQARRGPGDRARRAEFEYFVTLLDRQTREILQKNTFKVAADFPGNLTTVQLLDSPVGLTVPLAKDRRGPNYEILVGFQLSPDELEFNRKTERPR